MLNRVWVSSQYVHGEDHASGPRSWRPTGVRVDSMLSKSGKGTEELQRGVEKDDEDGVQEITFKNRRPTPLLEVRWSHSSVKRSDERGNEVG